MNQNYQRVDCPLCIPDEKIDKYMAFFHPELHSPKTENCGRCNGKGYIIQKADTIKL